MVVYVEYAFAENFLLDGMLLYLSLRAAKRKARPKRLLLAAALGAVFALAFPLLPAPEFLGYALKFAFGFLLCLVAFGRVREKAERKRYALVCVFFFAFSFAFAGALFALFNGFEISGAKEGSYELARAPVTFTLCGAAAFAVLALDLVKRLYAHRAIARHTYACTVSNGQKKTDVSGFLDSGNMASKNGTLVCFLSPDVVYELWESEFFGEGQGQVCDELTVSTVSGAKTVRLFKGVLTIEKDGKTTKREVYFSPSANMLSRGYKLLLHSRIFDSEE